MSAETILKPRPPETGAEPAAIRDPLDVRGRIAELRLLRNGWLDGRGIAPSQVGLDWLAESFATCWPDDIPPPYLFPTPDSHVLAEWSLPPWTPSLEIDLAHKTGDWHALNLDTDGEETKSLNLSDAAGWNWLAERIRAFGTETE